MRIKKQLADISPEKVRAFYDSRAQSYNGANLNNVTMLQDKNPELSEKRSRAEISKLLSKLKIDSERVFWILVADLEDGLTRSPNA